MFHELFAKGGLSLDRLHAFAQIVTASGMSKAAPGNPTKQSQYSRQLKELEEFFGVELIHRGKGRFHLTPEGRALFQLVQNQLGGLEEFLRRSSHARVDLHIGAGEAWLHWLVIPALNQFARRCSNVTPVLHNLTNDQIHERLLDGRLDVGFVRADKTNPGFRCQSVAKVQYRLFAPKTSSRSGSRTSAEILLRNSKIGLLNDSRMSDALIAFARNKGFELNVCLRATTNIQLVQAVREAYCSVVLPAIARSQFENGISEVELRELNQFSHTIVAAQPKQHAAVRPVATRAANFLVDIMSRHT